MPPEDLRVATLPQLEASGMGGPTTGASCLNLDTQSGAKTFGGLEGELEGVGVGGVLRGGGGSQGYEWGGGVGMRHLRTFGYAAEVAWPV